ncbi:MAG: oligosaccharide flippase family protein [Candidatus Hodarchaeota archaeon]
MSVVNPAQSLRLGTKLTRKKFPVDLKTLVTSDLKLVAKSSAAAFWSRIYAVAFHYLIALIIARVLGPKLMGSFFLGFTILSLLSVFCQLGLGGGLLKFLSIRLMDEDYGYVKRTLLFSVKIVLGVSLGAGALLFIFRDTLSLRIFGDPDLKLVLIFIAITLPFYSLFNLAVEALKPFKKIDLLVAVQNLLFPTLNLLLVAVLFWMGLRLSSPLTSLLLATLLSLVAFSFLFKRLVPEGSFNPGYPLDARELFSVSIPIYLSYVMTLIMFWADTVMVGIFETSKEVGIYTAAAKTAAFVAFFLLAVNYILPSLTTQLYEKGEKGELESLARRTARWNLIFALTVTIAFCLFGKEILSLFGREFVIAYTPLLFLSLGQAVNAGAGSVGYILTMTGFQKTQLYISCFSAVLNIFLNTLLIPLFSIIGAALATGFTLAFWNIMSAYFVSRRVGIIPYADKIPKLTGYLLMAGAISFIVKIHLGLVGGIACFFMINTLTIIMALIDRSDIMLVKSLVFKSKAMF